MLWKLFKNKNRGFSPQEACKKEKTPSLDSANNLGPLTSFHCTDARARMDGYLASELLDTGLRPISHSLMNKCLCF